MTAYVLFHFGYISAPVWAADKGENTTDMEFPELSLKNS